ncbi:Chloramphenicol acetyltransferase [Treponema phagedenis]|uniref:Chloramphenicol acetyltransferase n=1 Tax=Treponema phagedenis TaxID=162 RepID=A0A0B7GUY4_TREPH|nr:chloramphenicol acetyltransferase CAT [Treponema phagedenis]CEM62464.1 Chloramphenicol acetyltransferase [Treponema phagedenis]
MKQSQETLFSKIDIESWERKEYFLHYYNDVRCTYSVTVNVDITEVYNRVKYQSLRLYPTLIWWIANTVNHFEFLRFNHDEDGNIGYYDEINPSFTFMPPNSEKFYVLWCEYDRSFKAFYDRCVEVMDIFNTSKMFPMLDMPRNCFDISSVPWIEFTSFNLNVFSTGTHLPPIFTTGELIKENGRVKLPFSLQVHHAVCDGYHAGQFFAYLQKFADKASDWMKH